MEYPDDILGGGDTIRPQPPARQAPDTLLGTILDGRYAIEQKLGQGGFGSVYLASDKKVAPRKIVVKVMRAEELSNEWSKQKFKQEVEALARVNHPSIVAVLDSGETPDGRPYIVMQYIDGVSLRSLLTPEGMAFGRIANIIRQVGKALSAAHDVGIFHRDLKPENIMVQEHDGEDHVKIIDFGVAKVKNSFIAVTTAKDVAVGTIAYMSPEQLNAQPVTAESDVYALGVIAYEMLTGRRPTNPESAFQLLELQRSGIRIKPSDLRPGVPETAEEIVLKALSFDSGHRYARARDFGELLANALLGDDEETKMSTSNRVKPAASTNAASLETAHVLFTDIVGYSRLLIDEQTKKLGRLQEIVLATRECQRAHAAGELIRLPTGDGMALVFFQDPEAPVRCAVEIGRVLKANQELELRMGVHSGLVYRIADINTNMNVAGGGINLAQRVMDCGDSGHILLSKRVADDLGQLARWSANLQDLGEAEVKHGVRVHLFNLYGDDFGSAAVPAKLQRTSKRPFYKTIGAGAAAALVVATLIGLGAWYALRPNPGSVVTTPPATENVAATGPERSLTYWLTVQKMRNRKPDGPPIQSTGDNLFGNGWRFQFNLQPAEAGALYLLNVGPGKTRAEEYNILFPLPGAGQSSPTLAANQTMRSDWLQFVDQTGVEKIWIIWSAEIIPDLDEMFRKAAADTQEPGVITAAEDIARIQLLLKTFGGSPLKVSSDKSLKLSSVKGQGNVLISLVELSHEPQ